MLVALVLAAAGPVPPVDLEKVPVVVAPVTEGDFSVPVSESVRAATWNILREKPAAPVEFRLACVVMVADGAPGARIPADAVPRNGGTVDWSQLRDAERVKIYTAGYHELLDAANSRISSARLRDAPDSSAMFKLRFFTETISPADARPTYVPGPSLNLGNVTLAQPLNGALLRDLYPHAAIRYDVEARARVTCRIKRDLRLLCRDPGVILPDAAPPKQDWGAIRWSFRLATYEFASTVRLEPKAKDGTDVADRDLTFVVHWKMPAEAAGN